tara:strand:+ start:21 stop:269 length:249 start_codon:yes stop_codon:yes gene_type:complete
MNFRQQKDGSCILYFSEEEIKIIQNKKSIHFTAEGLRHFGNVLMRMVMEFNNNFDEKIKKIITTDNQQIKITEGNIDENKSI